MEIESLEVFSRTTHLVEVAQLEGFFRKKATLPEENLKLARSSKCIRNVVSRLVLHCSLVSASREFVLVKKQAYCLAEIKRSLKPKLAQNDL
jgi:hypothetical protein